MAKGRKQIADASVLVVGDLMLDRYWFGQVRRISPEAPVPVVKVAHAEERPGGAANVARNVQSIGAKVQLVGIVGPDEPGSTLARLVEENQIEGHLLVDDNVATVVKLRIIGQQQQMLRVDFEQAPDESVAAQIVSTVAAQMKAGTPVVISDYNKGAINDPQAIIQLARDRQCPIIVDPKGEDFSRYSGATVLTPNRGELRTCVGSWRDESDLTERAMRLRDQLDLDYLLVTRSEEGMSLYGPDGAMHVAAQAREVFDVSGAGDTVVAVLASAIGAGMSMDAAVHLANRAGALVVGKLGAATVSPDELFVEG